MEPGLHSATQLASQPPVQSMPASTLHWPSHAAVKLSGVQRASHPPVTTNSQSPRDSASKLPHASLPASAAEETSIRGAAKRPMRSREMDRRMANSPKRGKQSSGS